VGALASFQLRHVDLSGRVVEQEARTLRTKFAKTFRFIPVGSDALASVRDWIEELVRDHH
jgi:hypothetical protein